MVVEPARRGWNRRGGRWQRLTPAPFGRDPSRGERKRGLGWTPVPKSKPPLIERAREFRAAATPTEALLWGFLRDRGVGAKFYRQRVVGPFIPDFVCLSHRLIVEVDGSVHETTEAQGRDAARDAWLRSQGYVVLRVSTSDVESRLPEVLSTIRAALAAQPPRWISAADSTD